VRLSRDELKGYMKNWDAETRDMLLERMEKSFRRAELEHFSKHEAIILQAALDRLIPRHETENIDLVGFLDWAVGKPLGRGDREEGMPAEEEFFHLGIRGTEETSLKKFNRSFAELTPEEQDSILSDIQQGNTKFFIKLLSKALIGYCAHPLAWMRMGFPGPAYPEGYVWIEQMQILQRRKHFPGWKTF